MFLQIGMARQPSGQCLPQVVHQSSHEGGLASIHMPQYSQVQALPLRSMPHRLGSCCARPGQVSLHPIRRQRL